jgi:ABC-type uncharacterized transport system ATPase subunit
MSDRAEEVLRMEHITKQFGSVYANRDVSFHVLSGEVHTLLGENGAGKSTLMNVLFGLYQPTGGEIYIRGEVNASEVTGEELAAKMIGRELKPPQYPKKEEAGEDVIVLDHVSACPVKSPVRHFSSSISPYHSTGSILFYALFFVNSPH